MRITKKKALGVVALTAVVAAGGTAAYAYFTGTGSGAGTGTVGTSSAYTVAVTNPGTPPLTPGSGPQAFTYVVTNGATAQQTITTVSIAMNLATNGTDITSAGADVPGCLAAWFTPAVSQPTPLLLAAGASTGSTAGSITMPADATDNQDACKGAVPDFTITVT